MHHHRPHNIRKRNKYSNQTNRRWRVAQKKIKNLPPHTRSFELNATDHEQIVNWNGNSDAGVEHYCNKTALAHIHKKKYF